MIRVYLNPCDSPSSARPAIDAFPRTLGGLDQVMTVIYDERVTQGRAFATIDGGQVESTHGTEPT